MISHRTDQGRARGLYDEQLQRQQQEKLFRFSSTRIVVAETLLIVSEPTPPASPDAA